MKMSFISWNEKSLNNEISLNIKNILKRIFIYRIHISL